MIGLFAQLHLGLDALRAQQFGMHVTGNNIANVATPGFTRRRVTLTQAESLDLYPVGQLGFGVDAGPVVSVRARFLEARLRIEQGLAAAEESRRDLLGGIEAIFAEELGLGFQDELTGFFNAFADLASQPESMVFREQVLARAQDLVDAVQGAVAELESVAQQIDTDLVRDIDEVNDLLARIGELNERIAAADPSLRPANAERDERSRLLGELAELVEIASYENPDGTVTVTLSDGSPLVVGGEVRTLAASPSGPGGAVRIFLGSTDVTARIGAGAVGGKLAVRDQSIPSYLASLDAIAFELIGQVNTLHQAGFALDGATTGLDFFVPFVPSVPGDPTGAAKALALDPAVAADPSLVAAASAAGAPGDGTQAQAIADLRTATVLSGGTETFSSFYASFVFRLGSDAADARAGAEAARAVAREIENRKLSVEAVSLDEEAVALVEFQRAYEAAARFLRAVDELTEVALGIGA